MRNIFGGLLLFFLEGTKSAFIKELRVDYVDENGNKSYYYREKHSHWVVAFLLFSLTCYLIVFVLWLTDNKPDELIEILILSAVGVVILVVLVLVCIYKIEIRKEYFVYKNYIGRKRKFYYKEIDLEHRFLGAFIKIKKGKKVVYMPVFGINTDKIFTLYSKLKKKQQKNLK